MEHWKDILGYEGLYQVSDLGRVKSLNYLHTGKERVLAGKNIRGYLVVGLSKNGKVKQCKVHRLVAEAFIPNPDGLPCVNHRDECRTSNMVSNLEWCDVAYNNAYGTRTERVVKAESKIVYQYTLEGSLVRSYSSANEASRRNGYSLGAICDCCNGKRNHHKGFIWSYAPINKDISLF